MSNYAKANRTKQWYQDNFPGSTMNLNKDNMVLVLHTTEGPSWPGYAGGTVAPNYTGMPPVGHTNGSWRAHFPDEKSSRAMENRGGGVQTNTQNSVQVELIGTCDPKNKKSWNGKGIQRAGVDYVYWPDANEEQLEWLADFVLDMHKRHGLQLRAPFPFNAYPSSYGNNNGDRMTFAEWNKFAGICGHQHVPENSHGDPGDLDVDRVIKMVKDKLKPSEPVKPLPSSSKSGPQWGKPDTWVKGASSDDVLKLAKRIEVHSKALGLPKPYNSPPDSMFSKTDVTMLSRIQKKWWPKASTEKGGDADGYPGESTFERLAANPK